jgi:hypothetical protein
MKNYGDPKIMATTKTKRILPDLAAEQAARIKQLEADLKAAKSSAGKLKVSSKGGVSLYGLGRFPVTLYKSQWDKLLGMAPEIQDFITANSAVLATKD